MALHSFSYAVLLIWTGVCILFVADCQGGGGDYYDGELELHARELIMAKIGGLEKRFREGETYLLAAPTGAAVVRPSALTRLGNQVGLFVVIDLMSAYQTAKRGGRGKDEFDSENLCQLAGVEPEQLSIWLDMGVIQPVKWSSQNEPIFSFRDAFLIGLCSTLRRRGLAFDAIPAVARLIC